MENKKGFTLIELLAVIVILGILMLIAIPSVTKYIDSSKKETYVKTISSMVDVVRYGVVSENSKYSMDRQMKKFSLIGIELEKGSNKSPYGDLIEDYSYVVVTKTSDGYKYEVQAADTSGYCILRTDVDKLDKNSVQKCDYTNMVAYSPSYKVGDKIAFSGSNWYVIKDSNSSEDYVTLLKDYPLTVEEVEANGTDSNGVNHVNQNYPDIVPGKALNTGGYGGMQYYSNSTCGVNSRHSVMTSNCKTAYEDSDVKYIIDNWTKSTINYSDLKEVALSSDDSRSYVSRLITYDELAALGCTKDKCGDPSSSATKAWIYDGEHSGRAYSYWTMTRYENTNLIYLLGKEYGQNILKFNSNGNQSNLYERYLVRPVINLLKSSI